MADRNRARSVPKLPARTALSPAVDDGALVAMAEVTNPVQWTLSKFYNEVTSLKSPLHAFISGDVLDISCYKNGNLHYLLMCIRLQNMGVIVWLRAVMFHSKLGTIQFSADPSKLRAPGHDDVMHTAFATLNFRHVMDLRNEVSTKAGVDSRWCACVIIGMFHGGFNGSWVKPPPLDWLESTLSRFAIHEAPTASIERQFALQHPNAKKISLGDPDLWKNEPASLSEPPISNQDQPEGTHSNLAGTKHETAHVTSAPPEEHLHGSRPIQSPNANGAVPAAIHAEKDGGDQPRGREINYFNVLASRPTESLTPYDPHRHSISRTGSPLSGQTDERRPVQPTNPSSTPTPTDASTGIDEATSIRIVITAPSEEASNPQSNPFEAPDLTGRIVRLGSSPMGTGGYSTVWRGSLLPPTSDNPDQALQVAVKVLRGSYADEETLKRKLYKHLHIEMRIWAQLCHENVVRLLGHTEEPEGPGLVSVSYLHGDVLGFLRKNPSVNREIVCADVALGLQYLHEHKPRIIHGDLKGLNVLVDGEGRASICDFGLSTILDGRPTGFTSSNFGRTLRFLPPELLDESTTTVQTDIYSYACTCIEILFGQEPYHHLSKEARIMHAMLNHEAPFEPLNEEITFPSLLRILERCWDYDRSRRPPLNSIIDTIKCCLYRTYRANLGVHQGIGRHVRLTGLPGIEQAKLMGVEDDGLSIMVGSSTSFHRVPIYQRYRWEFMDRQNTEVDWQDGSDAPSLSGTDASSSKSPPYISEWGDFSVKFRLPYSSMVSYESYDKASS